MKAVVEFLRQLHAHNERAWFEAHRAEWLQLQERVRSFAEGLIEGIASFDPSVEGLTAKDCTYRIRFTDCQSGVVSSNAPLTRSTPSGLTSGAMKSRVFAKSSRASLPKMLLPLIYAFR